MIQVENLRRQFGDFTAVDSLSFTVSPGEVLGFLGPNGAGKSTTMKMLTGFLRPTSGSVKVFGHDIWKDPMPAKSMIGYLPEGAPSYAEMNVSGFLEFIAEVRGFRGKEKVIAIESAIDKAALKDVRWQSIDTLSKGYRRRVGLAQAILHDPRVLILDEPTDGLDPNQKHHVREMIRNLSQEKLVIVSTHILEEVSAVCSRAMIIARGKLLVDDTPANLSARTESGKLDDIFRTITGGA
jgi:ABC-2 type transport system ATP-binding protein